MKMSLFVFLNFKNTKRISSYKIIRFFHRKTKMAKKIKKGNTQIIVTAAVIIVIASFIMLNSPDNNAKSKDASSKTQKVSSLPLGSKVSESKRGSSSSDAKIKFLDDGTPYLIHPDEIKGGGPPKDGIPSIDNPRFIGADNGDKFLDDDELGIAIIHKGVKRFYPFQILVWHEIVNDVIEGDPFLITYCPLCGSGIVFEGKIDGQRVEFGTSGKLYNSNLVMYDRKTDTYWSQIGGRAILGELTGTELKLLASDVTTWGEWKKVHPDSFVLSKDTGFIRSYGKDPYEGYYESRRLIFPVNEESDELHPKAVIFGIEIDGNYKAYAQEDIRELKSFTDIVNGVNIKIERDAAGLIKFTNSDTGEIIPMERDFWFAWFAFHNDTELYVK
jgi:hypothetical protein